MSDWLAALPARNMAIFGRVDHAANAVAAGMALRPTDLIIFGNPKGGTVLMQHRQRAGIDLQLKALIWEDADGKVFVTYNDPAWIARRHGLDNDAAVPAMTAASALSFRASLAASCARPLARTATTPVRGNCRVPQPGATP